MSDEDYDHEYGGFPEDDYWIDEMERRELEEEAENEEKARIFAVDNTRKEGPKLIRQKIIKNIETYIEQSKDKKNLVACFECGTTIDFDDKTIFIKYRGLAGNQYNCPVCRKGRLLTSEESELIEFIKYIRKSNWIELDDLIADFGGDTLW